MTPLPTVLLHHDTGDASHYDWLLADPANPQGLLWTARVALPSEQWAAAGAWDVEPIGRHRRIYITYEGDIGDGRGTVRRIDEGEFTAIEWTAQQMIVDVTMRRFQGRLDILETSNGRWQARLVTS